jgi:hypothetical protein
MKFALMAIAAGYSFLVKQSSAEILKLSVFPQEKQATSASMFLNSDPLSIQTTKRKSVKISYGNSE